MATGLAWGVIVITFSFVAFVFYALYQIAFGIPDEVRRLRELKEQELEEMRREYNSDLR